jgi:hypothetical protein
MSNNDKQDAAGAGTPEGLIDGARSEDWHAAAKWWYWHCQKAREELQAARAELVTLRAVRDAAQVLVRWCDAKPESDDDMLHFMGRLNGSLQAVREALAATEAQAQAQAQAQAKKEATE